jgi:hypothetical protein
MQEFRSVFGLNAPRKRKSGDIDSCRITEKKCSVSTGLRP